MPRKEAAGGPARAPRRSRPGKDQPDDGPKRRSTARSPARRARQPGRSPVEDEPQTEGSKEQAALAGADLEARIRHAVDELEQRLARLAEPISGQAAAAEPTDGFEELSVAFRRAFGDAVDRRLEQALGLAARLYQRLEAEAEGLCDAGAAAEPDELRAVFASALEDLAAVVGALGGQLIRPAAGDHYDPIIHIAVGEGAEAGTGQAKVVEVVRPGCRSTRGRVVLPAKVIVDRG